MGPLDFIGPVSDLLGKIIDKAVPDRAAAEQAKAAAALALVEESASEESAFRKFVVDYEGAGDKVSPGLQLYRGSVRPTVTYGLILLFAWGFVHPADISPERMSMLWQLNLISLGFWFGERALSNLGLDLGKLFAARAKPVGTSTNAGN